MPQAQFLGSGSALGSARPNIDILAGNYIGFLIRLFGTTAAAETLLDTDIGRFRLERAGVELQGETFEFYHDYGNMKGGFLPGPTGGANAAEDVACWIPVGISGIQNALQLNSNEEADLILEFNALLDTRFAASTATYEVYGVVDDLVPERYELFVQEQDVNVSAAGRFDEHLNSRNLAALYLYDDADVVDQVQLIVDKKTVVDNIDDDVVNILSNLFNPVEAAQPLREVSLTASNLIADAINESSRLSVTFNASGTLEVVKFMVGPSQKRSIAAARVKALIDSRRKRGEALIGPAIPGRPANSIAA